ESRTNANIKRFEFRRSAVGCNNNLFRAIEQRIEQMAELVLDRFALKKLHVINHQQVDITQLLLERERLVIADSGCKAPHEIFSCQINDTCLFLSLNGSGSDCLQQVGFAKANGRMNEKRVKAKRA